MYKWDKKEGWDENPGDSLKYYPEKNKPQYLITMYHKVQDTKKKNDEKSKPSKSVKLFSVYLG